MAQSLDPKAAIKYAPNGMKAVIESIIAGHQFQTFLAADTWNKKKTTRWVITSTLDDVSDLSKQLGIRTKTSGNKKIVDYDASSGWKVRFRESQKKAGGRAPDAKTTRMQELGSAYVFGYALKYRKRGWKTFSEFSNDKRMMRGLVKLYPDAPDSDWLGVYFKQHFVILDKFGSSQINRFDHSGSNSFMSFITDIIKQNFGISKKDNWNPADIWGVRGSSSNVKKKIRETVFGSKDSQTIQQLNALLRGMFKSKELVGISLKKTSPGKDARWEEYNVEALTLDEIDEYKFKDIKYEINLGKNMTQDTKVQLRGSSGDNNYDFQIKANTSTEFSNLKWESTPVGARAARGGKAQVAAVVALMKDNGQTFNNSNRKYPQDVGEFKGKLSSYKSMFNRVRGSAITDCSDSEEFAENMENMFLAQPWVANSKLMQLTFLDDIISIKGNDKKYTEFWTDMVFLSIKKGDRFGPFGKLY